VEIKVEREVIPIGYGDAIVVVNLETNEVNETNETRESKPEKTERQDALENNLD
jgi:hypothetical protein